MPNANDYLEASETKEAFLRSQLDILDAEQKAYYDDVQKLQENLERTRQETVGYLLPEVSTPYLEQLQQRIDYPGLLPIKAKYDAMFERNEQRKAEIEAMDDIRFYDLNIHKAEELVDDLSPTFDSLSLRQKAWENNRYFKELFRIGFFETSKTFGWFQSFFNWMNVSFLMGILDKANEKYATPTELKDAYNLFRSQAETIFKAHQQAVSERDRLRQLKAELQSLFEAPDKLLTELYHELGDAILDHLEACPEALRIPMAEKDEYLDSFFRKEIGLQKQIDYLKELAVVRIKNPSDQLRQEIDKLATKANKLRFSRKRFNKYFSDEEIAKLKDTNEEKWKKRRTQLAMARQRISGFNQYNHGSFLTQFLWWDLLTNSLNGSDLFEVRQFYEQNPQWSRDNYVDPIHGASNNQPLDGAAESLASSMVSPDNDSMQDVT